jgi:hypothetical protein
MRRIDQIRLIFPQEHIFLQGKKDIEFDGMQCFFVLFFSHRISDSYGNKEETSVIKHLCQKRRHKKNKEKEEMMEEKITSSSGMEGLFSY